MKRETLEKIRKIIVTLLVLFISILNTWIAFCTLPVHAEESFYINDSNISGSVVIQNYLTFVNNSGKSETDLREWDLDIPDPGFYALAPLTDSNSIYALYKFDISTHVVNTVNVSYTEIIDWNEDGKSILHNETKRTNRILSFDVASWGDSFTSSTGITYSQKWVNPFPVFLSADAMLNYCKTGDTSGIINGGSDLDPHDDAYAFTGFSMSGKTATWTGTTERSYLLDMDVEKWVNYTYGFATSEDQEVSSFIDAEAHYPTSDKKLALPWDEMEANKKEGEFIRQVNIIPCYGTSGAGFYFGVPCKVFYHKDGSVDKIVRDFPQGSGDYSYKHIFTSDKYSTDIPAPELSAISHNGFTLLNNSNNDYYVDIILESNLYGVKMEKNAGTWLPVVDTDWIYNSHYYNFADTSQIAINNDVIYIPNLFTVNPESDLVDDFKKWSSEYSSYSSLPTMSFLKRSTAARTRYVDQFLFKDDSKFSDSEQLKFSHMAESVFYVRYYNKSMVYGPWVRYKFRDGYVAQVIDGTLGGAYIDVGQVDTDDSGNVRVDEKGNPIVSDNVSGRQDYDTGESDFSDGSFSLDLSDVTKFFDYLKKIFESVTGALSSFGSVVAACFGFLPGELVNALIFGICVMMFIGIIKAVKG